MDCEREALNLSCLWVGTDVGEKIHHCLEHCGLYMSMSPNERGDCPVKAQWCPIHLVGSHSLAACNMAKDPKHICSIDGCTEHHHEQLHGGTSPILSNILVTGSATSSFQEADNVLLSMQTIQSLEGTLACLFDNAATRTLITVCAARRLNLSGEPIRMTITTVSGSNTIDSLIHYVLLVNANTIQSRPYKSKTSRILCRRSICLV